MKTALEWLISEHFGGIENCTPNFRNIIEQAKEMEKNQIINAYLKDKHKSTIDKVLSYLDNAEEYYNKTYKSE